MKLTFLGTNGWYDANGNSTICTLVETKNEYIILDAGLGLHKFKKYYKKDKPVYLFISHMHLDHLYGMHILPMFNFKQTLTILVAKKSMAKFKTVVAHPFTGALKNLNFPTKIIGLEPGSYKNPLEFDCKLLKHADLTLGYRLYLENKIITYCCDTTPCKNDKLLAKNSDLLIHECAFRPGESSAWGHTNPEQAGKLAKNAEPKKMILTHFSADRFPTKASRKNAESITKKIFPNTQAAFDNLVINL